MSLAKDLSFGLPFFYRVVLPGVLLGAAGLPLISGALTLIGISITGTEAQAALTAAVAVVIGFSLSVLNVPIYLFYAGRRGWPRWIERRLTAGWMRRVQSLQEQAVRAKGRDTEAYNELWYEIRQYPMESDGTYIATRPTKMGNILASYEKYPKQRYGMDSVFYWYRLWLKLDKDTREEVDRLWASTDGLLYLAAGALGLGVVYLAVAGSAALGAASGIPWFTMTSTGQWLHALWGLLLVLASYVPYRLSLSGHVQNGEAFKSLFDLYRTKLAADLVPADATERARWTSVWAALQYGIDPPAVPKPRPTLRVLVCAALALVILRALTHRDG